MKFNLSFLLIIFFMLLNFGLQQWNFMTMENEKSGFYFFRGDPNHIPALVLNKIIRVGLNIITLYLVIKQGTGSKLKLFGWLTFILIILATADILLMLNPGFLANRLHTFLHPLAFSPLITLALLAGKFFLEHEKNQNQ